MTQYGKDLLKKGREKVKKYFNGTKICTKMPKGWQKEQGTLTEPKGFIWITNGKPLFAKNGKMERKCELLFIGGNYEKLER